MSGGERRVAATADRVADLDTGGAFEGCADRIDELGRVFRAGIITSREQELKVLPAPDLATWRLAGLLKGRRGPPHPR